MKVLLVEDDEPLAARLAETLGAAEVLIEQALTGAQADFLVRTERYDALILDLGLPDGNGVRWLDAWREDGIELPVLVLTARERWSDKAAGFSAGADDYVTKPFDPSEILLRLHALVRRAQGHAHPVLRAGTVSFDTHTGSVTVGARPIMITTQEKRVLAHLMRAAPRAVSRDELSEHVYERDQEPDSNVIDVQISRLRRKLGQRIIETVRGQGYRIADDSDA